MNHKIWVIHRIKHITRLNFVIIIIIIFFLTIRVQCHANLIFVNHDLHQLQGFIDGSRVSKLRIVNFMLGWIERIFWSRIQSKIKLDTKHRQDLTIYAQKEDPVDNFLRQKPSIY